MLRSILKTKVLSAAGRDNYTQIINWSEE